jgi:dTDP-4-dehydrorhamnose 3,5-epimerase
MRFTETAVSGAFVVLPEPREDARGFFARVFCQEEFAQHGLETRLAQCSVSWNALRGTLRGMHYQASPHQEAKLVSCTRGSIYDVVVDLRPASPTFRRWSSKVLTTDGFEMLYVPKGCAHGFLTLEDGAVVRYDISEFHHPESARGVRWDDPAFGIRWPFEPSVISAHDRGFPPFVP